ncbi:MAG: type II toxin-antitoxin system RelB/DinJ family antitoxin [Mycoplasmataceae bacterium]|jgi:DNA-damage-inducible protein J|nr:type II toxin-antitoxin system RelB/DinJ family antitoxin [Mycoplasmataceae bacterium]
MADNNQTIFINFRINQDDKSKFEKFCAEVGLSTSGTLNMFIKQTIKYQKIPFVISNSDIASYDNTYKSEFETYNKKTQEQYLKFYESIEKLINAKAKFESMIKNTTNSKK